MQALLPRSLPQSDAEWLQICDFETDSVLIGEEKLRYAYLKSESPSDRLAVMIGGIPRDPNRQSNLPLINKLYGSIALLGATNGYDSVLYQQSGTGGSSGDLTKETLNSRIENLVDVVEHFAQLKNVGRVSLIGMSLGSYLAARALETIPQRGIEVNSIVLQSPAAFPIEAESLPYGAEFSSVIKAPWDKASSPVFSSLKRYLESGGRVAVSYFEKDNPPIPEEIQELYYGVVADAVLSGKKASAYSIAGVEHNFRRIGSDRNGNVVHNGSVKSVALQISEFIS